MPVACPAFVKNFREKLRIKVIRLLPDDLQYVLLPGFKGGIRAQKPQEIVLWMGRDALPYHFVSHTRAGSAKKIVVGLGGMLLFHHLTLRVGLPYNPLVWVNMAVERKADVHQVLDSLQAVALDIAINAESMRHGIVDHVAVGGSKQHIVFEKIDVPKDMRSHEQVGNFGIGIEQKGQTGVAIEDDLIDFREPHGAIEPLALVHLAVRPVPCPCG